MALAWEQVLKDVISEVFETMFFTMVEFGECGAGERPFGYGAETRLVNHRGSVVISLRVSEEFARMITAGFMGVDETLVDGDDLEDSLKELANMVAGGYHARVNDADWKLGIPKAWKIGPENPGPVQAAAGIGFTFSGEPAGSAVLDYLPG